MIKSPRSVFNNLKSPVSVGDSISIYIYTSWTYMYTYGAQEMKVTILSNLFNPFTKEKQEIDKSSIFGNVGNVGNVINSLYTQRDDIYIVGDTMPILPTLPQSEPKSGDFPKKEPLSAEKSEFTPAHLLSGLKILQEITGKLIPKQQIYDKIPMEAKVITDLLDKLCKNGEAFEPKEGFVQILE